MADETPLGTADTAAPIQGQKDLKAATDQTTDSLIKFNNTGLKSQNMLLAYSASAIETKGSINGLTGAYDGFIKALDKTGRLTDQQVNQFGLLSVAALGVRQAFGGASLGGQGFSDQLNFLTNDMVKTGGAMGKLIGFAESLGKAIPNAVIRKGVDAVKEYVTMLAASADNASRLQREYIGLSAATGNLDKVFGSAGEGLENMSAVLNRQSDMLNSAGKATGLNASEVEHYYTQLGKVPGALEAVITGTTKAGQSMNMLTAAIKLSQGTGRSFTDIIGDLTIAFQKYGMTGDSALKFSARMGELSNNLGVDLASVQSTMKETVDIFSRYANTNKDAAGITEGLIKVTNEYVQALEASGMSGNRALAVVKDMTSAMANMNLQQKAFLSGQTGGPGGLMGAFQIEKMMQSKEGIEGVMKKMRDQMRQQFGRIVTLDEAASNQGAAAQMTKQIAILKAGPLGKMIGSDQDAIKMLDSFSKMDKGFGGKGLKDNILQQGIDRGTTIQAKMQTDIGVMRGIMESTQRTSDVGNLGLMQSATNSKATQDFQRQSAEAGGADAAAYKGEIGKPMENRASASVIRNIENFKQFYSNISGNMSEAIDHLQAALITPSDKEALKGEVARLEQQVINEKKKIAQLPKEKQAQANKEIAAEEELLKQARSVIGGSQGGAALPSIGSEGTPYAPGAKLGTAANAAVRGRPGTAGAPVGGGGGAGLGSMDKPFPVTGSLDVKITGYCINCGDRMEDDQAKAIVPIK